jgi:DNA-binding NtrC family response regulator
VSPELDSPHLLKALALARKVAAVPGVPVLVVACHGVPESVIESELFGSILEAHTGMRGSAVTRARPGTLFIDYVSYLGMTAQARLVSLMADRETGAVLDSRIVATATTDLRAAVSARAFLGELRDRISAVAIDIPPLRARPDDIERLAILYATAAARLLRKPIKAMSQKAVAKLCAHDFLENERELRITIDRAIIVETRDVLSADSIDCEPVGRRGDEAFSGLSSALAREPGRPATLAEVERAYIAWMLRYTKGNRAAASRMLAISYPTIAKKIAALQIDVPHSPPTSDRGPSK